MKCLSNFLLLLLPSCLCPAGTRITFARKGDELTPGGPAADLVFVVKQKAHPQFTGNGSDLNTVIKIPLVTALTGGTVSVQLLDGRSIVVPVVLPVSSAVKCDGGMCGACTLVTGLSTERRRTTLVAVNVAAMSVCSHHQHCNE